MKAAHIADRAAAYGIPGVVVDGMDVLAVYQAVGEAAARARSGGGPTLLECKTYRYLGHSRSDPGLYRPKEELEDWRTRDPIPRLKTLMLENGIATADEIADIEAAAERELEDAVEFARLSPSPQP
jgi:TPP-dependent pyruvate/acetoin dehydrogenase alpha subunit